MQTLKPGLTLAAAVFTLAITPWAALADDYRLGRDAYLAGDYAEALRLWKPLAEAADERAQFKIGALYHEGVGVPVDHAEAVRWFRLAADQGYAAAQFNLGNAYKDGAGVPRDEAQAIRWWRLAAEQEFPPAQYSLATHYYFGIGAAEDRAEAIRWYRRAAENGHPRALKLFAAAPAPVDDAAGTDEVAVVAVPVTPEAEAVIAESAAGEGADSGAAVTDTPPDAAATAAVPGEAAAVETETAVDVKSNIDDLIQAWAAAWAAQDVDAYLGFYSGEFQPDDGAAFSEWQRHRRRRLTAPTFIDIQIDNLDITLSSPERARATFQQVYRADRYEDNVTKTLSLVREGDRWRITGETSGPVPAIDAPAAVAMAPDQDAAAPAPEATDSVFKQKDWILAQDPNRFTVALAALSDADGLAAFAARYGNLRDLAHYAFQRNGQSWHGIIYGIYDQTEHARPAIAALPDSLRRAKPRVRPLRAVQEFIMTGGTAAAAPKIEADTAARNAPTALAGLRQKDWILARDPDRFTIALAALKDQAGVAEFRRRYPSLSDVAYYEFQARGGSWYGLVYGVYDQPEDAQTAVAALPRSLRRAKPRVRPLAKIQKFIREQN